MKRNFYSEQNTQLCYTESINIYRYGELLMTEQFMQNKKIIAHYYVTMIIAALLLGWLAKDDPTVDSTILIILGVYVTLFPIVILYTRKYAVHIFLFLLAFITGFYSFYQYSFEPHSILNALYFTFQLYLLDISDVFTADGSSLLNYPFIVEIARWSAASYTISTVFIAMYRILETSILLVYYQIVGNHYIIFGYNENSAALVEDLRKKKKRVILVDNNLSNESIDLLENLKVVVLHPHGDEENIYSRCRITRADHIILLHEDDVDNLNEYMTIQSYFTNKNKKNTKLTIHIHLQEITSTKLFHDLESTVEKSHRHFQVNLINLYDRFIDVLFEKYPIDTSNQLEETTHVLIIGFGPLGQHIALRVGTQHKYKPIHITAIDKNMGYIKQDWEQNRSSLDNQTTISLHSFDIEVNNIPALIHQQDYPITHIFVCLGEDKLDLLTGIELSNRLPSTPIFLEFSEDGMVDKWIQSEVSNNRLIYGAGTFQNILTEEYLLHQRE